jgi:hypothetical protein
MSTTTQAIIRLCQDCAASIYTHRQPTTAYQGRVARLLVGTAAAESAFIHRRQIGFSWSKPDGAWGLWQTEYAAVHDSLEMLRRNQRLYQRAAEWLFCEPKATLQAFYTMDSLELLCILAGWDRAACLMARLHYLRFPAPVPEGLFAQAGYWKKYYNTVAGAGTEERYRDAWEGLVAEQWEMIDG